MPASPDTNVAKKFHRLAAATLVELMVAISILLVVVLFLGQMLNQASSGWRRGEAHKEQLQTARAVMTALETDLQSALAPVNRSSTQSLQFFINQTGGPTPYSVPAEYRNRDAVFFQSSSASNSTSDVAEVGYFVKWDDANAAGPRSILCRFFASSADPEYRIYSHPADWISDEIITQLTPAVVDNSNPDLSYKGLLSENILGFWIQALDPTGQPISQNIATDAFDSRLGYSYNGPSGSVTKPACSLPSAVAVSFVYVASEYARRIGPTEKDVIQTQVSAATTAEGFAALLESDPSLAKLRPGTRAFESIILLKNGQ